MYTPENTSIPSVTSNNNKLINSTEKNNSYTPPPFVLKEDTSEDKTDIVDVLDLNIDEPSKKPVKETKKAETPAVIPEKDKKIIESKTPNEPKLIDENQFLPK